MGEVGTNEVTKGNVITMRPVAAKNPAVMGPGSFITYSYKLDGDTMWVTQRRALVADPSKSVELLDSVIPRMPEP